MRIGFDGDAVLLSDEAERVFQEQGLAAFQNHEESHALQPLPPGPFLPLLEVLHRVRAESAGCQMKIHTVLVTACSAHAHERAIRTLMEWKVEVDEVMFLGGLEKSRFLSEFEPRSLNGRIRNRLATQPELNCRSQQMTGNMDR